ncbi:MFS transporter [Acetobacter oeni]|uniref:MFS transporter n=1 Tax=Acetobacter oeni TaxID=304077 RepID=A0A511XQU7_9PROT|nr:MFS transporter [Acetobacter oeni]MBB3884885.1 SHS family lactate transporter-like MFS transporter [Acetobacter oeni]GBR06350.1 major facilitator superfamily transporter [Acetobacter oeni LMG 21952]GEN65325.1 MFS transporter [Acetobacter oeni]
MFSGRQQTHIVIACFGGWTMDAFDFFITAFALSGIARDFSTDLTTMTWAMSLPLATRIFGALSVGWLADKFGRRRVLVGNMIAFVLCETGVCLAPSLSVFLLFRALFGLVMGGEWGVCTSYAMESIPLSKRGFVSGLLQSGYPVGYLFAAVLYGLIYESAGWRGMYLVSIGVALCVTILRMMLPDYRMDGEKKAAESVSFRESMAGQWVLLGFAVLFMSAGATFSHATQDLYPTMLRAERGMTVHEVALVAVAYNMAAVAGCLCGGSLSQRYGRRKTIITSAAAIFLILPFWAMASGLLASLLSAVVMQFLVMCVYGVMPAYLNELAPAAIRSTFSGFVYQIGFLLTSANATVQAWLATHQGWSYSTVLALTVAVSLVLFISLIVKGQETVRIAERSVL